MHEGGAPGGEPDPLVVARQRRRRLIRRAAKAAFPGGVGIEQDEGDVEAALEATERAIASGAQRIHGAVFRHAGVCAVVDLMDRGRAGWVVGEVTATTSLREDQLDDVALQTGVVQGAGLDVERVDLVHLDRACVYPDLSNLFVVEDVSVPVRERLSRVGRKIEAARQGLSGPLPDVQTGAHCDRPTVCPFLDRCRPAHAIDHVSRLYYGGRRVRELLRRGVERIADIPPEIELRGVQDRQRRAVLAGGLVVDEGLGESLDAFAKTREGVLVFGTLAPPMPVWDGCRPYDEVPVQFASRVVGKDGRPVTSCFLPEGAADPRPALVRALVGALEGAEVVWTWNVARERRRVEDLMEAVPEEAEALEGVWDRLEDLLPLVRDHVYHPAFAGTFDLEIVLPVLVPASARDEGMGGRGALADATRERLLLDEDLEEGERHDLRLALEVSCRREVEGLAALHAWLGAHT